MAGVWTDEGLLDFYTSGLTLRAYLNSLTLRLYQVPLVIDRTRVLADFTESTFPGYGPAAWGGWSAPAFDGNGNLQYDAPEVDFISTGGSAESIEGYYATSPGGKCAFVQAAGTPFLVAVAGLIYPIIGHVYAGEILPPL